MFVTRKFRFNTGFGLNKRRFEEELFHWASVFSRIEGNFLKTREVGREHIEIDSICIMSQALFWGENGFAPGDSSYVPLEIDLKSYTGPGSYNVSWSLTALTQGTGCSYFRAFPFLGGSPANHLSDEVIFYQLQSFGNNERISLCGSGIIDVANDNMRAGIAVAVGGKTDEYKITGASLCVVERVF